MKISSPLLFQRYVLFLAVMIAVSWVAIPERYQLSFPRTPGPEFDRRVRKTYIDLINEEKPDVVLLGDSTLMDGVDPELLSELTGRKVSSYPVPGSASAFWYIVLKNNIVAAGHRPQAVVIVFRDTMLTAPGYRVHGEYFSQLDEYAKKQEPILREKAYLNQMNAADLWAQQYFPLYSAREELQKGIDVRIRYSLPAWLNCDKGCTDKSMYHVFTSADLEPGQLRNAVATAERYLYTPEQFDFSNRVDESFLPDIIELARKRGIQLILVRLKSQMAGVGNAESAALSGYVAGLSAYLTEQGVVFLDYGRDANLSEDLFADLLHLSPQGRRVFTGMLAGGLNEVLK